ncbi:hypothetical protein FB45DRAFT_914323 [Roridomyces roridus]|uniref:Mnn4-regulates the mannosylphosphorylation n=1 Tax=Roridomyces roridus TaxID=1738132 RepID=A0AAD7FQZ9_9AGAR|nr:hypothetical protein FB45DRAFT_914323 [Roridomyces roridus]
MNTLSRPLRTTFNRGPLALRHRLAVKPTSLLVRSVASYPGLKPGSEDFAHARQNIKEEASNATSDLAKAIAGGSIGGEKSGFMGITGAVASEVPKPVMMFGLAGGIPYVGAAATTVYLAHQAGLAAAGSMTSIDPGVAITILDQALNVQVTYGAVMLSFLGALHWGMEFAGLGGYQGYKRLALGAAPVLFAWPTLALDPTMALAAQWAGFTALWWADSHATVAGWTPKWYSQYRFYLSILTGTCILGSLAGITYWGPVGGHGLLDHELHLIRAQRQELYEKPEVRYGTQMTITPGDENFTRLRNTKDVEKEKAEKEGKKEEHHDEEQH